VVVDDASSVAAAQALEEVDAIRRRVVNVVGHALRTPVTTLCGMAESLARAQDDATRAALADGVVRNARLVERLLDQLLMAAGVSTVLPVGDTAVLDVEAAARRAWADVSGAGTLDVQGAASVVARPVALDQILLLVLDNAAKYTSGDVVVQLASVAGRTTIDVETHGADPSDEEVAQAFELFYRGEHAVMSAAGIGIGLPVARQLARLEDGDVTLFRRADGIVTRIELPSPPSA